MAEPSSRLNTSSEPQLTRLASTVADASSAPTPTDPPFLPPKPERPSPLIDQTTIDSTLSEHLSSWSLDAGAKPMLSRDYKFAKFKYAMDFVNDMVKLIKLENHHPVIVINFRDVTVRTYTHCAYRLGEDGTTHIPDQGITGFDFRLAMRVDALHQSYVDRGLHYVSKPPS